MTKDDKDTSAVAGKGSNVKSAVSAGSAGTVQNSSKAGSSLRETKAPSVNGVSLKRGMPNPTGNARVGNQAGQNSNANSGIKPGNNVRSSVPPVASKPTVGATAQNVKTNPAQGTENKPAQSSTVSSGKATEIHTQKPVPQIVRTASGSQATPPAATKAAGTADTASAKSTTRKPPVVPVVEETVAAATVKKSTAAAAINAFMKSLFTDGVTCVTAPDGVFPVKEEQRSLFALFSNGRFLVSENSKFDGRVLSFEVMARKRKLQVGKPEYVQQEIIDAIYEHAITSVSLAVKEKENEDDEDNLQMQKDFVTIIARAAAINVSDIHVVVANKTAIMFRVNGLMQTEIEYSKEWGESFVRAAFSSADISDANYAQNEYQAAQKLGSTPLRGSKGKLMLPKNVLGIRLQFNPIAFGSRYLVMRLLYADEDLAATTNSLMGLGFTERDEEIFFRLRSVPTGIVIISGPTGSGKSTTLQRNMIKLLEERNFEVNLLTVEDPPEYPIRGARQMPVTNAQTDAEKDIEFNKALAATLRSDPDVLMIGEIRTLSAAQLAFKGALSGHGVWTTLHANSAPAILMRLRDMGMEAFKLQDPSIIKGMIAQRLFRKLCPYCRVSALEQPNHPAVRRLFRAFDEFGVNQCYLRGPGCSFCNYKGVKGRTVVGELVMPDAKLLDLLINNRTSEAIDYWTSELNGRTLKENAVEKMLSGIIDIEEIERWCGLLDEKAVY
jgi:type II secretory ATPase GspE/PulE/Tfp pilus assembly ATPase PilB-like protein